MKNSFAGYIYRGKGFLIFGSDGLHLHQSGDSEQAQGWPGGRAATHQHSQQLMEFPPKWASPGKEEKLGFTLIRMVQGYFRARREQCALLQSYVFHDGWG